MDRRFLTVLGVSLVFALVISSIFYQMSARAGGRTMVLRVSGNSIVLERNRPSGTAKDTVKMTDLNSEYGVLLSGPDSIRIDARGMLENSLDAPVKYVFTRGTAVDSVQISRYGRIYR